MKSRYDFMDESIVIDKETQEYFPDPVSLNFHAFQLSETPYAVELDENNIKLFWKLMHEFYGSSEYDDVVLSLNNISHKNFLKPGDVVYIPSKEDIERSFKK